MVAVAQALEVRDASAAEECDAQRLGFAHGSRFRRGGPKAAMRAPDGWRAWRARLTGSIIPGF